MSAPTETQTRKWIREGSRLFATALSRLSDDELAEPSLLPGWSRRHVVAHLAANAEGLRNLVHWAATGEETPMYSSREARDRAIEEDSARPARELRDWSTLAGVALDTDMAMLSHEQWSEPIRVGRRTVPATQIRWLRAREVLIHAVDLRGEVVFGDLPRDFCACLVDEIAAQRSTIEDHPALALGDTDSDGQWSVAGRGEIAQVVGPLPELVAYLTGRPASELHVLGGGDPPPLPAWL